ncbi:MAG: caspase family protein, partial [Candidatus Nitrosopolaris sp.]
MITGAQRKALIVGISEYTSLQKLDFCKNDGTEVYEVLSSLGYEISDENKLVGEAKGERVRDAIYDFFDDKRNNFDDTLLFYYSGHGVPGADGEMYLASSDTDPDKPYRRGFSFEELRKRMENTIATKVVVILDCCYSGSAKISKGHEEDAAKIGRLIIEQKSRRLPEGQGKYILSSSQSHQEAYALTTGEHSIFTYYLLEGLRGNTESIDSEGNVTPQSLGNYVIRAIMSLPPDERPRQRPVIKAEESGNVILASYPEFRPPQSPSPITPI